VAQITNSDLLSGRVPDEICPGPCSLTVNAAVYANAMVMCDSYCWIRNTYFLPFDADIPTDSRLDEAQRRRPDRLPYYQWVPLILLVQALCFYFPYRVWTRLSRYSGLDVNSLVEAGQSFSVTDMSEIRDKTLMYMTFMTDRCVTLACDYCSL